MADKQSFLSKQGLEFYHSRLVKDKLQPASEVKRGLIKITDFPCYTSNIEQKFSEVQFTTGTHSASGSYEDSFSFLGEDVNGVEITPPADPNDIVDYSGVVTPLYTVVLDEKVYEHLKVSISFNNYLYFKIKGPIFEIEYRYNSSLRFSVNYEPTDTPHNLSIYKEGVEIVHKLDSKYLPDGAMSDVSWDDISDKPFGVIKVPRDIVHISNSEDNGLYMIDPSDIDVIDPPYVDSSSVWDSVGGDEPYLWAGEDDTNDAWTTSPHMDFSGILDDPADIRNLKFKVTYDGVTEILPVEVALDRYGDEDYYYIGQPDWIYNPETETTEYGGLVYPFQIKPFFGDSYSSSVGDESSDIRFRIYVKSGALHDVTVSIMVDGIKKIDSEYLSWDLIPDKPFGVTKVPRGLVRLTNYFDSDNNMWKLDTVEALDPPYKNPGDEWTHKNCSVEAWIWGPDDITDDWSYSPVLDFSGILEDPKDFKNLKFQVTYDGVTEILPVNECEHDDQYYIGQPPRGYNEETKESEYDDQTGDPLYLGYKYPFQIVPYFEGSSISIGGESFYLSLDVHIKSGELHDVSISVLVDNVKKIDSKYLPDEESIESISDSTINALFAVQEVLGD